MPEQDIKESTKSDIEQRAVDTIRTLSIDAVEKAQSGHPGMPMGMADVAYVLWTKFLKHNPDNPNWFDRDRFILSAGHGSMLLYSLLHLAGYNMSMDDLKNFRQWGSKTPGHPEYGEAEGVETTTGPLGQGFGTGIGMAIAEEFLAGTFNKKNFDIVDHYTYAIVSDGDIMEGISHESASLAGHLGLGKIIYYYDANNITIDGNTKFHHTEDVKKRFEGYNWEVIEIDGHDRKAIEDATSKARANTEKPSLILCHSHIGYGSPNKQDDASSHGAPLGEDEVRATKEFYGWDPDKKFYVPEEVREHFQQVKEAGAEQERKWQRKLNDFKEQYPEDYTRFNDFVEGKLNVDWKKVLPQYSKDDKGEATRKASGKTLNSLAGHIPNLIAGSADLFASTKNYLNDYGLFQADNKTGRNIYFGVREHAMAAAVNGMALHGGIFPHGATFLIFSDYARPAMRIAALSNIPSVFVFTHDSIGLGEDGPTHQSVEQLASFRAMPNMHVYRPADASETNYAWKHALERKDGPTLIALSRQGLPNIATEEPELTEKGAYILSDSQKDTPDAILMGSGSEVQHLLEAQKKLKEQDIDARVVSMPCWEVFEQQPDSYKEQVLPESVGARVSLEAASTFGWERYVGTKGSAIGVDRFGASAPSGEVMEKYGITADHVVEEAQKIVKRSS